jgi:tetratricopeptide (TPR) repeat protein
MVPTLENPNNLDYPAAAEQIIKTMFADYRRVVIRREFGGGYSGGRVLEIQPIKADGTPELPVVVKFATLSLIQKEWQASRQHIHRRLPFIAEARSEPVLLPDLGWGGLRYTLMGAGDFEVMSLRDYCRRADITTTEVSRALERLLRIMGHIWNFQQTQTEFNWASSYDYVLPANLLIQVGSLDQADYALITPDNLPGESTELGRPVRFAGFAVNKVDPTTYAVDLNRPQPPAYTLRCKFPTSEPLAAYQAQQIIDSIEGHVLETRSSRLQNEVRRAMGADFELGLPTLSLSPLADFSLPNPLLALPTLLQHRGGANVASIHGDFNLENILIEAETGMVSLIDFAESREDHVLHDFLRLETEVLTKLLPEIFLRRDLPLLPTLAGLYWQLHWAVLQPTSARPRLAHPDLEKSWAILATSRRAARQYFLEVDDISEYYRGLTLYLLGALKFKSLSTRPESPWPKQLAFWGAVLAYQFFSEPPVAPGALPPYLDAILKPPPPSVVETDVEARSNQPTQTEAEQKLATLPLDFIPALRPLPARSRMPLGHNPLFVGRRADLQHLARAVKGGETIAIGQATSRGIDRGRETAATTGLGGMGKTQLACEFVHRYGQFFAGGGFWLSFADPNAIPAEIAACGAAMELRPDFGERPLEEQVRLVLAAWQDPLPRLLVFDNCEDPALLARWRPSSGGCRILLTSRRADWEATLGVQTLPLDVLSRSESIALLREHQPDADDATLNAIAEELGDLPLAIHLAGSYLARYRHAVSPVTYLLQLRDLALLRHRSLQGSGISPTGHIQHVGRTFALSYDQFDPNDPIDALALATLARSVCFALGEPIPCDLLILSLNLNGDNPDAALQAEDGMARLIELGLVKRNAHNAVRLHRLVAAFVQDIMVNEMQEAQTAVETTVFEEANRLNRTGYPAPLLAWQPHLRAVTDRAERREDEGGARLCNELGKHLWWIGDYAGARPYYEKALAIWLKIAGKEHPNTAEGLNNLGCLLRDQGELAEAQPYLEQALRIRKEVLGEKHRDTAESYNQMGRWLYLEMDLDAARQCFERALAVSREVLGEEHPLTADYLNNLGMCLKGLDDLVGAHQCLEQALAIRQKVLGAEHPRTALSLNNMGYLLQEMGKPAEARPYHEQALAIRQKILGEKHPDTSESLNNLGNLLQAQGELEAARSYLERALAVYENLLGKQHPDTAFTLNNLGTLLQAQGDLNGAQLYLERALAIRQKALVEDHPLKALSLNNLGLLVQAQGDLDGARRYLEQALMIRRKVLGEAHLFTAESLNNLGILLQAQGDTPGAQLHYEQALEIFKTGLGSDHTDTRRVRDNLASLKT